MLDGLFKKWRQRGFPGSHVCFCVLICESGLVGLALESFLTQQHGSLTPPLQSAMTSGSPPLSCAVHSGC